MNTPVSIETVVRAAQILRTQPACTMSLTSLHGRLREELGAAAGTYAQIYHQLKQLSDSFLLIDAPLLLHGTEAWPAQVREEYNTALESAGLGACTRVALTDQHNREPQPGAVSLASMTMGELWTLAEDDSVLRDLLARAAQQLEDICSIIAHDAEAEPPTILPRAPRP